MFKTLTSNIYKFLKTFLQALAFSIFIVSLILVAYYLGQYLNLDTETTTFIGTAVAMFGVAIYFIFQSYRQSKREKLGRNPTFSETVDDIKSIPNRLINLLRVIFTISLTLGKWILICALVI